MTWEQLIHLKKNAKTKHQPISEANVEWYCFTQIQIENMCLFELLYILTFSRKLNLMRWIPTEEIFSSNVKARDEMKKKVWLRRLEERKKKQCWDICNMNDEYIETYCWMTATRMSLVVKCLAWMLARQLHLNEQEDKSRGVWSERRT